MAVYWFSLCKVPKSIINKIRMKILAFLWSGDPVQSKFHLVQWEEISRPVDYGGWGMKNLHLFSVYLRAKILWMVLTRGRLWSQFMKDKYFRRISMIQWVGSFQKWGRSISNVWAGLLGAFNLFSSWLAWTPRDGRGVLLGEDPMLEDPKNMFLSRALYLLHCKGFFYLNHISLALPRHLTHQRWISAAQLGLYGVMAAEWTEYVKGPQKGAISLNSHTYRLCWSFDTVSGKISTKKAYQ